MPRRCERIPRPIAPRSSPCPSSTIWLEPGEEHALLESTTVVDTPTTPSTRPDTTPRRTDIRPRVLLARKIWLCIHLCIGLAIGLELALVGFTGSLLVFNREIDAWFNSGLLTTQGTGVHQPIDHIFAAARAAVPAAQGPDASLGVQMPFRVNATYLAWIKIPGETPQAARWHAALPWPRTIRIP
jgi:hypothetical protein